MKRQVKPSTREFTDNYDNIRAFILVLDLKGTVRNINKKGCEVLGIKKNDALGKNWFKNFISPQHQRLYKKLYIEAVTVTKKLDESFENPVISKKGTERIILWHSSFVKDKKKIVGLICSGEEVTEQRKAAIRLSESEENYRTLVDTIYQVTFNVDFPKNFRTLYPKLHPSFVSDRVFQLTGFTAEEFRKGRVYIYYRVHPGDRNKTAAAFKKMVSTKKPVHRGYRFKHKNGTYKWFEDTIVPKLNDKNKIIGCAGVISEVTEKKIATEKLKESEESFRTLVENIYQLAFHIQIDGKITKSNGSKVNLLFTTDRVFQITGFTMEEFRTGRVSFIKQIHKQDRGQVAASFCKMIKTKKTVKRTYRFIHKKGHVKWFEDSLVPKLNNKNKVIGCFGVISEVTEQRSQQDAIRNYEKFFALSKDMFCIASPDGYFLKVNHSFEKVLGYSEKELTSKKYIEFIHPDDIEKSLNQVKKFKTENVAVANFQNRYRTKAGNYKWLAWSYNPPDENGIGYATARDITEEKNALATIQDYENFFALSQDMFCIAGTDGFFKKINPSFKRVLGFSDKELLSKPFFDFVHPEDKDKTAKELEKLSKGEITVNFENRYRCRDGSYKWLAWTSAPAVESQLVYAVARDITEHKNQEEQLRKNEAFLNSVVENIPNMIFVKDAKELKFVRFNKAGEELLGYKRKELLGKNDYDLFPKEEADFFTEKDREVLKGKKQQDIAEEEIETRKNGKRILHTKKIPLYDQNGKPEYLLGISEDITVAKQAREALKKSEEKYREIVHLVQEGIWTIDKKNITTFVNEEMGKILGYKPEEIVGKSLYEFMDEEGIEISKRNVKKRKNGISERHDFKFKTKNGEDRWAILNTRPLTDLQGKYIGAIASVADVTERRRSEELIRENMQKLTEAQKIANLGSWEFDVETQRISWSDENYRLFGLKPDHGNITQEQFRKMIHPDDREELILHVENAIKKGIPFEMEMRVVWPDKSVHYITGRGRPVKKNNRVNKLIGIGMDITERKVAESHVMNALVKGQDLERRRIADDLHDSLGQKLSAIKVYVENNSPVGNKRLKKYSGKLESLLDETIEEVRNISHNLIPSALEDFGLKNTLEHLCNRINKSNGTTVTFQAYGIDSSIDKSIEFGMYRIAQELLNNAMKHSKAKEVNIQLFKRDKKLILTIEDDGTGFNSKKINLDKSFGLSSITSRTKTLNGIFNLDSHQGGGTIASIEIPLIKK